MTHPAQSDGGASVAAHWLRAVAPAALCVLLAVAAEGDLRMLLLLAAAAFAVVSAVGGFAGALRRAVALAAARRVFRRDPTPCLLWSPGLDPVPVNAAAREAGPPQSQVAALFADPATALEEMAAGVARDGQAERRLDLSDATIKVKLRDMGGGACLLRIERAPLTHVPAAEAAAVVTLDAAGRVIDANRGARRLFGGLPEARQVWPEDREPLPLEPRRIGGEMRRVLSYVRPQDGGRDVVLLPADAVGAPAPAETGDLFDRLPVALLRLARDGEIRAANRLARDLLRLQGDERVALGDVVEGLGRAVDDWVAESADRPGVPRSEVVRASRPSAELYLRITLGPAGGDAMIAVLADATELKTLEAQFVQSQKMQAIGQLAGGVAHDFNNLLTAISGHCDLLLMRHDAGHPNFADLEQINQNANRAASLVGQLLAFSRKQNLRPEPLDLRDTLADLTHLLNRLVGAPVNLSFRHDSQLKLVRADKRQIEQVIMNLVVNARDAMPGGGRIEIETSTLTLAEPLNRDRATVPAGDYVTIRVTDDGVGIPPDKITKIFEPFFTTKRVGEGTGLGLSTAYGIVKQTGGFIFADSVVDEGTTFTIYLPAFARPPKPAARRSGPAQPLAERPEGTVLLVEDEAPVRAFAARALKMRGLRVLEADSGEAALELLADSDMAVDVFVSDVVMPGLDGPAWVARALGARPGTRVVFVSGYAEESIAHAQTRIANSVFLQKPFSLAQLVETVERELSLAEVDASGAPAARLPAES